MAPLLGILYISKAQIEFNTSDLVSLGEKASGKNQQIGITGYLYFERGDFLQYIEGSPEQVVALMKTIELDIRHRVINQEHAKVDERKFPDWHMQYLSPAKLREINMEHVMMKHLENFKGFKGSDIINPEEIILRMVDQLSSVKSKLRMDG